jgi:hypothetical protein
VTKLFRSKNWLTVAQIAQAWGAELARDEPGANDHKDNLVHMLFEDIANGRLDNCGPLCDGRRLGLRIITPDHKPGFIEGRQLIKLIFQNREFALHRIVIMKEALLDFAKRHQLPAPTWWRDDVASPVDVGGTGADASPKISRPLGKQPRVIEYLREHFPDGVPPPGLCPRQSLISEILKSDKTLKSLDNATLKKAIDAYNSTVSFQKTHPK